MDMAGIHSVEKRVHRLTYIPVAVTGSELPSMETPLFFVTYTRPGLEEDYNACRCLRH